MSEKNIMLEKLHNVLDLKYPIAIILGGLPGSGKSTIANHLQDNGFFVLAKDNIRYELAKMDYGDKPESMLQEYLEGYYYAISFINNTTVSAYNKINTLSKEQILADIKVTTDKFYKNSLTKDSNACNKEHIIACIEKYVNMFYDGKAVKGIVFDATHFTVKQRRNELNLMKKNMPVYCVYIDVPAEVAYNGVQKRMNTVVGEYEGKKVYGRSVPKNIIESMEQKTVLPSVSEGFDKVFIFNPSIKIDSELKTKAVSLYNKHNLFEVIKQMEMNDRDIINKMFPSLYLCKNFNQENHHHMYTLDKHMIKAAELSNRQSMAYFFSALLHDVGKYDTKGFYANVLKDIDDLKANRKVKIEQDDGLVCICSNLYSNKIYNILSSNIKKDNEAHYYNHEKISALKGRRDMLRLGFTEQFANKVYNYILYHMYMPFNQVLSQKQIEVLASKFTYEEIMNLIDFRYCDEASAHQTVLSNEMEYLITNKKLINKFYNM